MDLEGTGQHTRGLGDNDLAYTAIAARSSSAQSPSSSTKAYGAASVIAEELPAGMGEATLEKCEAAALERFELEAERS